MNIYWVDDNPYNLNAFIEEFKKLDPLIRFKIETNKNEAVKYVENKANIIDVIIAGYSYYPYYYGLLMDIVDDKELNIKEVNLYNDVIRIYRPKIPCIFLTPHNDYPYNYSAFYHSHHTNKTNEFSEISKYASPSQLYNTIQFYTNKNKETIFKLKNLNDEQIEIVKNDIKIICDESIEYLKKHPEYLYTLNPHLFEELIGSLLRNQGYFVELTKKTRDGGLDMYATSKTNLGDMLFVVECKRYEPQKAIPIDLVQRFYGVIEAKRANAGIFITTSSYSQPAVEFQKTIGSRLSLKDYNDLKNWLSLIK